MNHPRNEPPFYASSANQPTNFHQPLLYYVTSNCFTMASNKELRLQQAINDYQMCRYTSIRAAAAANDVDRVTLGRRLHGGLSVTQSREPQQSLTNTQEILLKGWIIDLEAQGHAPTFSTVRELAIIVSKSTNGPQSIGKNWVKRFIQRHPELRSKVGRMIHTLRLNATNPEDLNTWFALVQTVKDRYRIQWEHTYNMDEHGIALWVCTNQQVIGSTTTTSTLKKTPENRGWVSIIGIISAIGARLKPLIIFKG